MHLMLDWFHLLRHQLQLLHFLGLLFLHCYQLLSQEKLVFLLLRLYQ